MRTAFTAICLLASLLMSSCFTAPKEESNSSAIQRAPSSINKKLATLLKKRPISSNKNLLEYLNSKFGPPQHQEFALDHFSKPQPGEKVYILFYDGFELRVSSKDPLSTEYALEKLILHENIFTLPYGLKIGTEKEQVEKILGHSDEPRESEEVLKYCDLQSHKDCVSFHLNANKVERIIWE